MRAVLQRVDRASVSVDGVTVGEIGQGLMILVCAMQGDSEAQAEKLAVKIAKLRIFKDDQGKMNLSVKDAGGAALIVSQFTLAAEGMESGNRPGFSKAAGPEDGKRLYDHFCATLRQQGLAVETGIFAADMKVALVNDGPVTILFDTAKAG